MAEFGVWASFEMDSPVTDDVLLSVNRAWDQSDEGFCSNAARNDPSVLELSFDVTVEGDDYDGAFARARAHVERLAITVGVTGTLRPLVGYTEGMEWRET
jgi:hypothetical protein